jgi:hypothetical protein
MAKYRRSNWQNIDVSEVKLQIKQELDQILLARGESERYKHARLQVQTFEHDESPSGQLRRFIYVMSILVHHERYHCLTTQQLARIYDLATAILKVQGVKADGNQGFLYLELQAIMSQIHRKDGRHWISMWEQSLIHNDKQGSAAGQQLLALARRHMRLGNVREGSLWLDKAEPHLKGFGLEQAKVGRIRCLILQQEYAEASTKIEEIMLRKPSAGTVLELSWRKLIINFLTTREHTPLMRAIAYRGKHHFANYIFEGLLWLRSLPGQDPLKKEKVFRLPKATTYRRKDSAGCQKSGFLFVATRTLDECYDTEIPIELRMKGLGEALESVHKLRTIEREMLLWLAAARFCSRSSQYFASSLAFAEYQSLSLRVSMGANTDVLGLAEDLRQKQSAYLLSEAAQIKAS